MEGDKSEKKIITKSLSYLDFEGINIFDDLSVVSCANYNEARKVNGHLNILDNGIHPTNTIRREEEQENKALLRAAATGNADNLRELLRAAGDQCGLVDSRDENGRTPLMVAAERGHTVCCEVLLEAGASPFLRCPLGRSSLLLAASGGQTSVVDTLLSHFPSSSPSLTLSSTLEALSFAAARGSLPCVQRLLEEVPDRLRSNVALPALATAARVAAERGDSRVLCELLLTRSGRRWRWCWYRKHLDGIHDPPRRRSCSVDTSHASFANAVETSMRVGALCLEDALLLLGATRGSALVADTLRDPHTTPRLAGSLVEIAKALSRGRSPALHLAAQAGDAGALDLVFCCYASFNASRRVTEDGNARVQFHCDLEESDANGFTPLQAAARAGAASTVLWLLRRGAHLVPALDLLLQQVPHAERRLLRLLDSCVALTPPTAEDCGERLCLRVGVLRPCGVRRMAVLERLFAVRGRRACSLVRHPLVDALVHLEWRRRRYALCVSCHFLIYALYLAGLAYVLLDRTNGGASWPVRYTLLCLCAMVLLAGAPFLLFGRSAATPSDRVYRTFTRVAPPLLSAAAVAFDYPPLGSFALIFSWLALLHYINCVPVLSHKSAMFQYIMRKLADHIVVFVFVLTGFSLAFYLLYGDDRKGTFQDPWQALLSTTLVLLQGGLDGTPLFKNGSQTTVTKDVQAAGGVMQQLFVITAVLALLNMWVALAVRGGQELEDQGHLHYRRNQVQVLSVLEQLFSALEIAVRKLRSHSWRPREAGSPHLPSTTDPIAPDSIATSDSLVELRDGDLPRRLIGALRRIANRRRLRETSRQKSSGRRRRQSGSADDQSSANTSDDSDAEDLRCGVHTRCCCWWNVGMGRNNQNGVLGHRRLSS